MGFVVSPYKQTVPAVSLCGKARGSKGGRRTKEGRRRTRRNVFLSVPSMRADTITIWLKFRLYYWV